VKALLEKILAVLRNKEHLDPSAEEGLSASGGANSDQGMQEEATIRITGESEVVWAIAGTFSDIGNDNDRGAGRAPGLLLEKGRCKGQLTVSVTSAPSPEQLRLISDLMRLEKVDPFNLFGYEFDSDLAQEPGLMRGIDTGRLVEGEEEWGLDFDAQDHFEPGSIGMNIGGEEVTEPMQLVSFRLIEIADVSLDNPRNIHIPEDLLSLLNL
jgi:hypothetical protein